MASGRQIQKKGPSNTTQTPATGMFKPRPFAIPAEPEAATAPELQTKAEPRQIGGNRLSRIDVSAPPPIQPKLAIGAPDDKYEQEADTIARKVVKQISAPTPPDANGGGDAVQRQMFSTPSIMRLTVQRREAIEGGAASSDLESTISQARSSGMALGEPIRRQMEGAFGADFSGVRVHTNRTADTLNRSLSARAFTTGNNIFFKQGEYNPSSSSGKELLAHELTHVVQQNGSSGQNIVQSKAFIQRDSPKYVTDFDNLVFEQIVLWLKLESNKDEKLRREQGETLCGFLTPYSSYTSFLDRSIEAQKTILQQVNGGRPPKNLEEFKSKLVSKDDKIRWSKLSTAIMMNDVDSANKRESKVKDFDDEVFANILYWLHTKSLSSKKSREEFSLFTAYMSRLQKYVLQEINGGRPPKSLEEFQPKLMYRGEINWALLMLPLIRETRGFQDSEYFLKVSSELISDKLLDEAHIWLCKKADSQKQGLLYQNFRAMSKCQQKEIIVNMFIATDSNLEGIDWRGFRFDIKKIKIAFKGSDEGSDVNWNLLRYNLRYSLNNTSNVNEVAGQTRQKNILHPNLYQEIIDWLRDKAKKQNKEILFDFFMKQTPEDQETVIDIIAQTAVRKELGNQKQFFEKNQPYVFMELNKVLKKAFKGFSLKNNKIAWEQFANLTRQVVAGKGEQGEQGEQSSSLWEQLKNNDTVATETGLSALDRDLQASDRILAGLTGVSNLSTGLQFVGEEAGVELAKSLATPIALFTSGLGTIASYQAFNNDTRADQARVLQHGAIDQNISLGARANKRNQMLARTGNIVGAVKGAAAFGAIAALGAGFTCAILGLAIPVITVAGLLVVGGKLLYSTFKKKTNKKKLIEQLLGIDSLSFTNENERDTTIKIFLNKMGYNSVDPLYDEFLQVLGQTLYQKGVMENEPEATALIDSLGLKIDLHKTPPTPSYATIISKLKP